MNPPSFSSAFSRRSFLQQSAKLGAISLTGNLTAEAQPPSTAVKPALPDFCLFTKHLIGMEPPALAEHVAALGFAGVEAPIRLGGHVVPERAAEDLPAFVEALQKANLKLTILTSGINAVSADQHTETVLRTAAKLGVKYFRMNWYQYDLKRPLPPQLDEIRTKVKDLLTLSRELGIRPLSQNHNGPLYVGASIWDLESVMRDYPTENWGFAYDIMHATVVGGTSWPIQYHLARPRIGAAYFKDFNWASRLKPETCPLGDGMAAGPEYAKLLRDSGFAGPVSLHIEYLKAEKITNAAEIRLAHQAAAHDLAKLKAWWAA